MDLDEQFINQTLMDKPANNNKGFNQQQRTMNGYGRSFFHGFNALTRSLRFRVFNNRLSTRGSDHSSLLNSE